MPNNPWQDLKTTDCKGIWHNKVKIFGPVRNAGDHTVSGITPTHGHEQWSEKNPWSTIGLSLETPVGTFANIAIEFRFRAVGRFVSNTMVISPGRFG